MQDLADLRTSLRKDHFRAAAGEIADADQPFRLEHLDSLAEVLIASGEEQFFLRSS
jgi:hypothetical protein